MSDSCKSLYKLMLSLSLPFTVLVIMPFLILCATHGLRLGAGIGTYGDTVIASFGFLIFIAGIFLLCWTIKLFFTTGKGTLAPWSPPEKLVIEGPYRHTRNPMISAVVITLIGEAVISGSIWIFIMGLTFFIVNHFYFIYFEEPCLLIRFGEAYARYKQNVPRWLPRLKAWDINS